MLNLIPYIKGLSQLRASLTPGIVYRGILLGLLGLLFLLVIIIYKAKLSMFIYIYSGIYLVSQIITIFVSPVIKNIDVPSIQTIMGLSQALITVLSVICYVTINKCIEFDKKVLMLFAYL